MIIIEKGGKHRWSPIPAAVISSAQNNPFIGEILYQQDLFIEMYSVFQNPIKEYNLHLSSTRGSLRPHKCEPPLSFLGC